MNLLIKVTLLVTAASSSAQGTPELYIDKSLAAKAPKSRDETISDMPEIFDVITSSFSPSGERIGRERREIKPTCNEIQAAVHDNMYATFDEGYWYEAQVPCNHSLIAKHIKPPTYDFLDDKGFSDIDFFTSLLPEGVLEKAEEAEIYNLEHGVGDKGEFSYSITANSIESGGYNFGMRYAFSLQYAGDINSDGIKDMIIEIASKNLGGNGFGFWQIAVTRFQPGGKLVQLELDWMTLASGGH